MPYFYSNNNYCTTIPSVSNGMSWEGERGGGYAHMAGEIKMNLAEDQLKNEG